MARDQFIVEMHDKLHPGSNVVDVDDLTGEGVEEIMAIIDDKHAVKISSGWHSNVVHVDLNVLKHVLTSAALSVEEEIEKQDKMSVGDLTDGDGKIEQQQIDEWEFTRNYFEEQRDAIKLMTLNIVEPLIAETSKPGFYMRGVEVDGEVGS